MNIAINLLPFRKNVAGAGNYAKNIVRELSLLDTVNDYYLFVTREGQKHFQVKNPNFKLIINPIKSLIIPFRIFWEQIILPQQLKSYKIDILFTPSVAVPYLYNGLAYTTIHDLAYEKVKTKYTPLRRKYVEIVTKSAVKKSDVIFTVSEFSKKEIESRFVLKNKRILVTYNGVNESFFKDYTAEEILYFKEKYKLPGSFVLYVGAIEPGKNIDKLISAFSHYISENNSDIYLVLTGGLGWKQSFLTDLISQLHIEDRVVILPYIPEPEMPLLYKSAALFAYLSEYEGFGIPVLEAMASGTPVLTSKSEAIMEFASNFVESVDPSDIMSVVGGIKKLIDSNNSQKSRNDLAKNAALDLQWINSALIIYKQFMTNYKDK